VNKFSIGKRKFEPDSTRGESQEPLNSKDKIYYRWYFERFYHNGFQMSYLLFNM
jgi:hypothetical protein